MSGKALAVLATSVALASGAPQFSVVGAPDSEMLFQQYLQLAPIEGTPEKKTKVHGAKPFSEIWEDVRQTATSITDSFGEVADDAGEKVEEVTETVREAADSMSQKLASALEEVLKKIQTEADLLLKTAEKDKSKFLDEVNSTMLTATDTIIPEFAAMVSNFVHLVDDPWNALKAVVKEAASTIASAFKAAGQEKLSTKIEAGLDSAVHYAGKFLQKLDSANLDFQNSAKNLANKDVEAMLKRVDDTLNDALQHIAQFILQFQEAFTELIDSLSNAVSWTTADVDAAFSPVHHRVTSIGWRVRSAGRDVVLPVHSGLVRVAKKTGVHAPVWQKVEMPVLQQSSASRTHGPLALVLALFTAATLML